MNHRILRLNFGAGLWLGGIAAGYCSAQPASPSPRQPAAAAEIAAAAKSPEMLARYVESHRIIDWKVLRNALGLEESEYWLAPCAANFPAGASSCSAAVEVVPKPDQALLTIQGSGLSYAIEHLRYLKDPKGAWQFAGENSAYQRNSPSHHELVRLWDKPFLRISSDHSQNGAATQQVREDWFDLTQRDFEPVFSFTSEGDESRFGFGVGRKIRAAYKTSQTAALERIELTLHINFDGEGLNQAATFLGVYERATAAKTFTLRTAYSGSDGRTAISPQDFEDLSDPFSGLSNEKLLGYALPGLQKIATGSDAEAKEWLRSVLDNAKDTAEKRGLLKLLARP